MGKKKGKSGPGVAAKAKPEALIRMNFLCQAADLILKQENKNDNNVHQVLSAHLSHSMVTVSKKAVLRLEPDIKKRICKGCHLLRNPLLHRVKVKGGEKAKRLNWICVQCQTQKSLLMKNKVKSPKVMAEETKTNVKPLTEGSVNQSE